MRLGLMGKDLVSKRPWLLLSIAVSFLVMLVMMIGFHYVDSNAYISWSVEFWDCIFGKTDLEFYEYSILSPRCNLYQFTFDKTILTLIPLAIWDFPAWVVHQITGEMLVTGMGDIIWMKLGFAACVVWIAIECSKIVKKINPNADNLIVYPLVFSSADILISTMYAGQDEIIYLAAFVAAVRCIVYDKKYLFVVFSAISVALCPEMLIPVLLCVVFHEKRIWAIVVEVFLIYAPNLVFSFAYRNNEVYQASNLIKPEMVQNLFGSGVSFSQDSGNVSLFIIAFCLLCFYAYTRENSEENKYNLLWSVAVLMTSLTLLSSGGLMDYFYRSILYVPFVVVLIVISRQKIQTNLILYGLYSLVRVWICCLTNFPQNMSSHYLSFDNYQTQRLHNYYGYVTVGRYIGSKFPIMLNIGFLTAVCIALAIVIFTVNYKKKQDYEIEIVKVNKDIITFVVGMVMPLILLVFAFMCYSTYKSTYSINYSKHITFGDRGNPEDRISEYGYADRSYTDFYLNNIIYWPDVCSSYAKDIDGSRHLYIGGSSFGPYISLYEGTYVVTISGSNLDHTAFDFVYTTPDAFNILSLNNIEITNDRITYMVSLEEMAPNVEIRIFNASDEEIIISSIDIQEV